MLRSGCLARKLAPSATIKDRLVTTTLERMPAKLLEKESHLFSAALITQVPKPIEIGSAATRLAFAARNEPVNARQVELRQGRQQRFGRNEPHRRRHVTQVVDSPSVCGAFDADAHPHIARPR